MGERGRFREEQFLADQQLQALPMPPLTRGGAGRLPTGFSPTTNMAFNVAGPGPVDHLDQSGAGGLGSSSFQARANWCAFAGCR